MIYQLDAAGRFTGETYNRTMKFYEDLSFIPRVTNIPPLPEKNNFDVVFNGTEWVYLAHELNESTLSILEG